MRINNVQAESYQKLLAYMKQRLLSVKVDLQPEEIKLINLVRVILQGGWIISTTVL